MISSLIALVFSGVMNTTMTIHLPKGVEYREVCVYSAGEVDNKMMPGTFTPFWAMSCYKPYLSVEDHKLRVGTYAVIVTLELNDGTYLRTQQHNIRPVETEQP